MGVWNETDGLTSLPIRSGRVKVFLLLPARDSFWHGSRITNGSARLSPDCSPICLPLTGDYNEYGSLDNIREDATSAYTEALFKALASDNRIVETDRFKDLKHYGMVSAENTSENIINLVCQNLLGYIDYSDEIMQDLEKLKQQSLFTSFQTEAAQSLSSLTTYLELVEGKCLPEARVKQLEDPEYLKKQANIMPFGIFFVLEKFFDAAVTSVKKITKTQAYGYGSYCVNVDYHKKGLKTPKKALSALKKLAVKEVPERAFYRLPDDVRGLFTVFGGMLAGLSSYPNPHCSTNFGKFYFEYALNALKTGNGPLAEQTIQDLADYKHFVTFMSLSRKTWMSYEKFKGRQDYEFYLHKALAAATTAHIKELEKECRDGGYLEEVDR